MYQARFDRKVEATLMATRVPRPLLACFAATVLAIVSSFHGPARAESDKVSLSESTTSWRTLKYATDADNGFIDGSLDPSTIVPRTFKTYLLENGYLKVTLLPEFGGRILSMIYKPTGHEELYRTKIGVPYGIRAGNFYYDWMMVYGGIFPTFPDAEHGKTWLKPWDFRIVKESADEVTVSMSIKDDFAYGAAPKQFRRGFTSLEATYVVTLKAGRAALDTRLILRNPNRQPIDYEYWTCTTLAPGSDPDNPMTTAGAEIIAPIERYTIPHWSANLAEGDQRAGAGQRHFNKLRWFKNWPTMGIAYAAPDMQGGNFWGVINHDNGEGILRIADNMITKGLKMWTWGFPSLASAADAYKHANPAQPYIELWAGVSDQFFHSARMSAAGEVSVAETYSPTVGMSNVTQANENILVNLLADASAVKLQFLPLAPQAPLRVRLKRGDTVLLDDTVQADPKNGNLVSAPLPSAISGDKVRLSITTADGKELIAAETAIK
jgi:hypothetical protein